MSTTASWVRLHRAWRSMIGGEDDLFAAAAAGSTAAAAATAAQSTTVNLPNFIMLPVPDRPSIS
jgi:phage/plasmid primase-like uncharacterized protein